MESSDREILTANFKLVFVKLDAMKVSVDARLKSIEEDVCDNKGDISTHLKWHSSAKDHVIFSVFKGGAIAIVFGLVIAVIIGAKFGIVPAIIGSVP